MAMNGPWHFYKCWSFTAKVQNNFKLLKKKVHLTKKGGRKKKSCTADSGTLVCDGMYILQPALKK